MVKNNESALINKRMQELDTIARELMDSHNAIRQEQTNIYRKIEAVEKGVLKYLKATVLKCQGRVEAFLAMGEQKVQKIESSFKFCGS